MDLRTLIYILAMVLAGCDADARACARESSEAAWQACNRSCTDSNDKASCDRAKVLAVEVCTELSSEHACRAACGEGDKPACERATTLGVEQGAKRPTPLVK
jgi:hypothetical protein